MFYRYKGIRFNTLDDAEEYVLEHGFDLNEITKKTICTMDLSISELKEMFPYFPNDSLKLEVSTNPYKTERGFLNHMEKRHTEFKERFLRPSVDFLEIEIEWYKNKTWGTIPHASMRYGNVSKSVYEGNFATASGYGYDKESTVIAACCNKALSGMLYKFKNHKGKIPYGLCVGDNPHFSGGVGTDCYYEIAKFLGGKLEHVASGKYYDKFIFTFNSEKQ